MTPRSVLASPYQAGERTATVGAGMATSTECPNENGRGVETPRPHGNLVSSPSLPVPSFDLRPGRPDELWRKGTGSSARVSLTAAGVILDRFSDAAPPRKRRACVLIHHEKSPIPRAIV
jgi:hypothetical protein